MFPTAHSVIDYNEAGEPVGWDNPGEYDPYANYCDMCGYSHIGDCYDEYDDDDEGEEYRRIIVDGTPWKDSDGNDSWPVSEADSLVEVLTKQGYSDVYVEGI